MFVQRGKFTASARYQSVDIASRIEGATPHQLVQLMYEELLKSIDAMAVAAKRGDYIQRGQHLSRALNVLTGLETSLDFDKGGEIATGLAAIYRETRRLVIEGGRESDPIMIVKARDLIHEISTAWDAIAQQG